MDKPKSQEEKLSTHQNNVIPFQVDAAFFFERAVHYLDRHDLKNALKNFRKAAELEPDNPVNHCNLAGVLSELGEFEESNKILQKILKEIDPDLVECHFYMANNCANLGDYEHAEEHITRYLELDPRGEFAEDAEEMLQILMQEFGGGKVFQERKQQQEDDNSGGHDTARKLLEEGKFMEASAYLEKAVEQQPDSTAPRNNLSLAYYYQGDIDKAIEIATEVLERDPSNVHALCNLAVFHQHLGNGPQLQEILEGLRKLYPLYFDHTYKLATTMGILGEHTTAYRLFKQLLRWGDRTDTALLHCVAASAANLGFLEKAKKVWSEIQMLDPDSETPVYYLNKVNAAIEAGGKMDAVSYQYHIPFQEQFRIMKEQIQTGQLGTWRNDPLIRSSLFWALKHGDLETKMQVIQTFALLADKEVEHVLREFIKNPEEIDQLKRLAIYVLRHIGAEGPFQAHLDKEEVLLRVQSLPQDDLLTLQPEWQEVLDKTYSELDPAYGEEARHIARDLWTGYLNRVFHAPPRIVKIANWAAALEYAVLRKLGAKATQADVAARYGVAPGAVSKIYRLLMQPAKSGEDL
ncbi:tetratricopeptide repeat protein [Tumebacillus avium]|uniref:tetratricopeptide repeat protein n=1 Tax=Tumebacillus avium TaxID=1903704 RepID=UPI0018E00F79|nr:tetratricopeptide repeat protein [Tumebacillus avium]